MAQEILIDVLITLLAPMLTAGLIFLFYILGFNNYRPIKLFLGILLSINVLIMALAYLVKSEDIAMFEDSYFKTFTPIIFVGYIGVIIMDFLIELKLSILEIIRNFKNKK